MIKKYKEAKVPLVLTGLIIVSLVVSALAVGLHFYRTKEIVYVDAQRLVSGFKGTQDAKKEYTAKSSQWQANLDTLRLEVEARIGEYESTASNLSIKERSLMEELIQSKQQQYMNYQQVIAEKAKQEDQDLSNKVLVKVNDYVKRYGEKKGYSIILAATQFGNIVYAEQRRDITDDVLEGLNNEYAN